MTDSPIDEPAASEYVFVWREIKPTGWRPKMLWARLLRRKLEVYTYPKRMTDLELTTAVLLGMDMGCMPQVYVRLTYEDASDWTGTISPTDDERTA